MEQDRRVERMKELVRILSEASRAYYQESREIMPNIEYDRLYDELLALEKESGIRLAGSPTAKVGYEVLSELPKEAHPSPMLSLDKTKSVDELISWLGGQEALLSWKMDGLTIVLTYRDGELFKAVTRGNGEIGEVITANARTFKNIPLSIAYKGELVLRGEAVIKYSDFNKINDEIEDEAGRYKNPRNLCAGSVRQLSSRITAERNVHFYAFTLVSAPDVDFENSREKQLRWLEREGFEAVYFERVNAGSLRSAVEGFASRIADNDLPSDGLVLTLDDIAYGASLGRTAKFPRDSIAFKWSDETRESVLREIEWSASRTGLINPVAVFDPVELEGTSVSRASVHNVSIVEALKLGIGDRITVYKANMIIPQIAENLTESGTAAPPDRCPVCGGKTEIRQVLDVKTLHCINPDCPAKKIKSFDLFVSRNALNINGLSEETLSKFIERGFLKDLPDIFGLDGHMLEIINMEGFGEKSYTKLISAIDAARKTTPARLIYGLGIGGIGAANARLLCRAYNSDIERLRHPVREELLAIDQIGDVLADAICEYFADEANQRMLDRILDEISFEEEEKQSGADLTGMTFVITGSLEHFSNRKELQELIESLGGKAAGSVSAKTTYLINNDTTSNSTKNKTAKALGIPIISEEEALRIIRGE